MTHFKKKKKKQKMS